MVGGAYDPCMFDSLTKHRTCVLTDRGRLPCILVQEGQLREVKEVLDFANVRYEVKDSALPSDSARTHRFELQNADVASAQSALDEAAVKVSVRLVNGNGQTIFQPQSFIDRYDSLRQEGIEGNDLVHELLTDDWGVPPTSLEIEGQRSDGTPFHASLSYESRRKRR